MSQMCEACGLLSAEAEYIRVRTTNGGLVLCRQCLDDVNRKNQEVAALKQEVELLKTALKRLALFGRGMLDEEMEKIAREALALSDTRSPSDRP
jgi:hypothetical protein